MIEVYWVQVGSGWLALSNRPKLKDIAELPAQGCQRVITIQGRNELPNQVERAVKAAGMAWTWVPIASLAPLAIGHGKFPEGEADLLMRRGLQELVESIEAGESVLIRCSAGIHRTGMLTFALLRWLNIPEIKALDMIEEMRSITRADIRAEHLGWGNQVAAQAGRG
jgi:protein-tyrosine phosphatase